MQRPSPDTQECRCPYWGDVGSVLVNWLQYIGLGLGLGLCSERWPYSRSKAIRFKERVQENQAKSAVLRVCFIFSIVMLHAIPFANVHVWLGLHPFYLG